MPTVRTRTLFSALLVVLACYVAGTGVWVAYELSPPHRQVQARDIVRSAGEQLGISQIPSPGGDSPSSSPGHQNGPYGPAPSEQRRKSERGSSSTTSTTRSTPRSSTSSTTPSIPPLPTGTTLGVPSPGTVTTPPPASSVTLPTLPCDPLTDPTGCLGQGSSATLPSVPETSAPGVTTPTTPS